jgi:hypothetical protein
VEPGNPVKLITEKIERTDGEKTVTQYRIYKNDIFNRVLYIVEYLNQTDVIVTTISPNTGHEYQNVYYNKTIDEVIKQLTDLWNNGRFVSKGNSVSEISGAISRRITHIGARKILEFEFRYNSSIPLKPTKINKPVDLGTYLVEAWGGSNFKRSYSYLTFSKETDKWLLKVVGYFGLPKKDRNILSSLRS